MSADSFLSYRNVVSQVYRLTMLIAAKRHEKAADAFDAFLDDLAQIVAGPSTVADIRNVDSFLERDPPSPRTPPVNEADAHPVRIIIHETDDAASTAAVRVEKLGSVGSPVPSTFGEEEEGEALDEKEEELTLLEMATHPEEGEAVEETEVEATEEVVDDGEVIEETEEEVVENEELVEETEEVEATEEEVVENEEVVEETEEVEANEEETEETTEEETEEVEETEEETEEVEATEEETEEVEATEEETEETTEEEEEATEEEEGDGGLEAITIGKVQYYLDSSTNHVFAFVSDDEAGEYVGKMVNNKLVRG